MKTFHHGPRRGRGKGLRATRPRLEALESRLAPCVSTGVTEAFDGTPAGGLPAGWAAWSSDGGGGPVVSPDLALSAPNGLAATAPASSVSTRAWPTAAQPADVEVSAAVYLDSLIPAGVLARGGGLATAAPSYYAAAVTRGLGLELLKVTAGTATVLAQIRSPDYVSGRWVCVTLSASGTTLRAQVHREDNFQYLSAAGRWQTDPAWALSVTDAALAGPGLVGVATQASYTGTVAFDDFGYGPAMDDTVPPTVSITSPAPGATLSGVVTVRANATDNVGVTKVEFDVDGVPRATQTTPPYASPYAWDFDTSTASNGSHTLQVLAYDAAGNVGRASEAVTTQNDTALQRPDIPRHYTHIRIAELAYGGNPMGAFEDQLLQSSVDLVVPNAAYLAHVHAVAPNTPQVLYTNASSLYLDLLTDWLAYADAHGLDREGAFYHVNAATPFSGSSPSSQPVAWFWAAYRGGAALADVTRAARGTQPGGVTFGAAGESVYVGYPDRFREINLDLASGADAGWAAALEYPTAVDAQGNPTAWSPLTPLADTTAGLTQPGQVTFDPPADWVPAAVGGSARLYYVRFRTTSDGTAPVANTLLGRDYVGAGGTTSGVIPAFDYAADADRDGYLNDAEYANRAAGKDARFAYEGRAFAGNYGQMRFATNPGNLGFKAWAVDFQTRYLAAWPLAAGLFVDNSSGAAPVDPASVREPTASYAADYGALLNAVGRAVAPRWLLVNAAGGGAAADPVVQRVQAYFEEFALRPLASSYGQFEDLAGLVARRAALTSPPPYAVLDSLPAGGSPTDPRTQLATLAEYYLVADPASTFLDFYGGYAPASSWTQHWSAAAAYNVGQPAGSWSVFATGQDPENTALTYRVYQRPYGSALVLYRPLSYGGGATGTTDDATATTFALGASYYPLQADGTLGPAVTSVTLRNGEGAILIKAAAGAAAGPPPAQPAAAGSPGAATSRGENAAVPPAGFPFPPFGGGIPAAGLADGGPGNGTGSGDTSVVVPADGVGVRPGPAGMGEPVPGRDARDGALVRARRHPRGDEALGVAVLETDPLLD